VQLDKRRAAGSYTTPTQMVQNGDRWLIGELQAFDWDAAQQKAVSTSQGPRQDHQGEICIGGVTC
jgi:hypothetical protein